MNQLICGISNVRDFLSKTQKRSLSNKINMRNQALRRISPATWQSQLHGASGFKILGPWLSWSPFVSAISRICTVCCLLLPRHPARLLPRLCWCPSAGATSEARIHQCIYHHVSLYRFFCMSFGVSRCRLLVCPCEMEFEKRIGCFY